MLHVLVCVRVCCERTIASETKRGCSLSKRAKTAVARIWSGHGLRALLRYGSALRSCSLLLLHERLMQERIDGRRH